MGSFLIGWLVVAAWPLLIALAEASDGGGWLAKLAVGAGVLLAGVIAWGITKLIVVVLQKFNIDLDAAKRKALQGFIRVAVLETIEWASRKLKTDGYTTSGQEKMERVLAATLTKYPGVSKEEAEAIAHSTLVEVGEGAANSFLAIGHASSTPDVYEPPSDPATEPSGKPSDDGQSN